VNVEHENKSVNLKYLTKTGVHWWWGCFLHSMVIEGQHHNMYFYPPRPFRFYLRVFWIFK